MAEQAAKALDGGFVCVDLAMTEAGEWIVIESNDAMESGYPSISPLSLRRRALEQIERAANLL